MKSRRGMTPMTAPELLPCPFCGGEAEFIRRGTPRYSTLVRCTQCACFLESNENFDHGNDWNTRADLAQAMVAAAYDDAADELLAQTMLPLDEPPKTTDPCVVFEAIRARIPDDAKAALERIKQEARNESLREALSRCKSKRMADECCGEIQYLIEKDATDG